MTDINHLDANEINDIRNENFDLKIEELVNNGMIETIDIVKLIEENPITRLDKSYQSRLINKIKHSFTTDEQQLFVTSFYCYLNCSKDDFVIDLDDIWQWLGYSKKDKSKDLLEKYFKAETDYKIIFPDAGEYTKAGRPKEKILMTVKTFKKVCMKANTSKSNDIHDYFIKLEEILHELLDEESSELRSQLDITMKEKNQIAEKLEEEETKLRLSDMIQRLDISNMLVDNFRKKHVVYIGYIGKINGVHTYSFGYTDDIVSRVTTHRNTYGVFILIYCIESCENKALERELKHHKVMKGNTVKHVFLVNGKPDCETELFNLDEDDDFTIEYVKKLLQRLKTIVEKHTVSRIEEEKTFQEEQKRKTEEEKTRQEEVILEQEKLKVLQEIERTKRKEQEEITKQKQIDLEILQLKLLEQLSETTDITNELLQFSDLKLKQEEQKLKQKKAKIEILRLKQADAEISSESEDEEISKFSSLSKLRGFCRKNNLDERGNNIELYYRVKIFQETGEIVKYQSLEDLQTFCKENNLYYTGDKVILYNRISHFLKTGENVRYVEDEHHLEELAGESIENPEEKEQILCELNSYTLDKLKSICRKYFIVQEEGSIDILREKVKQYFEKGIKKLNRRREVYLFNKEGIFVKHYNTLIDAKNDIGISINTISNAVDKKYTLNGYIFRSANVKFRDYELEEINKIQKKSQRHLTKDEHIQIKQKFFSGVSKQKLMEEYSKSNTQIKRIIAKKDE